MVQSDVERLRAEFDAHVRESRVRWKQQDEDHAVLHGKDGLIATTQDLKTVSGIRSKIIWAIVAALTACAGMIVQKLFGG